MSDTSVDHVDTPHVSFRLDFDGRQREIVTDCFVAGVLSFLPSYTGKRYTAKALWDTGATRSAISPRVVKFLGLQPTDDDYHVTTASGRIKTSVYAVDMSLTDLKLAHSALPVVALDLDGIDVLIGMDIIGLGDFAICGGRVFSYCSPPCPTPVDLKEKADKINARAKAKRSK